MENIDFEALRSYLMDYFGAAASIFPFVFMDVDEVMHATGEELIQIAIRNKIDLGKFTYGKGR